MPVYRVSVYQGICLIDVCMYMYISVYISVYICISVCSYMCHSHHNMFIYFNNMNE